MRYCCSSTLNEAHAALYSAADLIASSCFALRALRLARLNTLMSTYFSLPNLFIMACWRRVVSLPLEPLELLLRPRSPPSLLSLSSPLSLLTLLSLMSDVSLLCLRLLDDLRRFDEVDELAFSRSLSDLTRLLRSV